MESIRVRKYNRTVSVLNGTGTLLIDLDDKYEYGFSFARSALGNNQFNAYPMKIPSRSICQFLSTYYREYRHMFLKYTNLPSVPEEGLCPFPNGTYWAKDAYVDSSVVPQAAKFKCYGVHFARSAQGNNQFNAYPMKLAAKPFCEFVNVYYREYQHLFLKYTNLPFVPPEGLCPFPKGTYWAKDAHFDSSVIPVVVPEGLWRATTDLVDTVTGELVARGSMYVRLSKELM